MSGWNSEKTSNFLYSKACLEIEDAIHAETERNATLKKRRHMIEIEHGWAMLEADKANNPRLWGLKKKLLVLRQQHHELSCTVDNLEHSRHKLNQEYSSIIQQLKLEEKMKGKIKVFEEVLAKKEEGLRQLEAKKEQSENMLRELDFYFDNRTEIEALLQVHVNLSTKVEEVIRQSSEVQAQISQCEKALEDPKSVSVNRNPSRQIRHEIRKLEREILKKDKEVEEAKALRIKTEAELVQTKKEFAAFKEIQKSAPPKPAISFAEPKAGSKASSPRLQAKSPRSPGLVSLRSMTSVSTRRRRKRNEEEEKRTKMMTDVERNLTSGETAVLLDTLKTFGKSGQGVASKLIELNRQQFK